MTVKNYKVNVKSDPAVRAGLLQGGNQVADAATGLALGQGLIGSPSQGGAASIRAELVRGGADPEVHVSWDRDHFYMGFAETGTQHQRATPFLRPAANGFD